MGRTSFIFGVFDVDSSHPVTLIHQVLYEMMPDKAAIKSRSDTVGLFAEEARSTRWSQNRQSRASGSSSRDAV
jgi:hypothetical protein